MKQLDVVLRRNQIEVKTFLKRPTEDQNYRNCHFDTCEQLAVINAMPEEKDKMER